MIRTTTNVTYNADGSIIRQVVEQEEIQPDATQPAPAGVPVPCADPDCDWCNAYAHFSDTADEPAQPADDGCGTKSCTECYPTQQAFAGQAGNAQDTVRSTYRPLSQSEATTLSDMKSRGQSLIIAIRESAPEGRERSIALTRVEEAVMWATKAITT